MRPRHLLAAALAFSLSAGLCLATPPTDEQIDALIARVNDAGKDITDPAEKFKAQSEAVSAGMKDISWNEVSAAQFDRLAMKGLIRPYPKVREASFERLKELSKQPTVEGARCADIMLACWPAPKERTPAAQAEDVDAHAKALAEALAHPKMGELFKAGKGSNVLYAFGSLPRTEVRDRKLVDALEPYITADLSPMTASALGIIFDIVTSDDFGATPEYTKRLREKIAAAATAASSKDDPRLADDPKQLARMKKNLTDLAATCNSAWARGELMDHEAPPITFSWSNAATPLHSFADLKGRVVVVDFWATWCGPCVGSFPEVRRLTAHYQGYPVTVLGVTSDQGYHIARSLDEGSKPEKIDCEGDPAKEHGLMSGFIKDMDMTWTVAFSDKNVFNPDFGVRGIPHIAIIDPAGKVRYNGLRPGNLKGEVEKIDGLLKEFKLPTPTEPVAEKDEDR